MKPPRPFSVTLSALGVLTISVYYWTRLVQVLRLWDFIASLGETISPLYLALTGLVFGLMGLFPALGLWVGASWAPRGARAYLVLIAIYYWLDRLILATPVARTDNWTFALGATAGILVVLFWVLARPAVRVYFET